MTRLVKSAKAIYVPSEIGQIYVPPQPGYWTTQTSTECSGLTTQLVVSESGELFVFASGTLTCTEVSQTVFIQPTQGYWITAQIAPASIEYALNQGWNSYAETIATLDPSTYLEFNVLLGSFGAFIGVGRPGVAGSSINSFVHGVMVDGSGVKVFERGVAVHTLAAANLAGLPIRIARLSDGRILYSAGSNPFYVSTESDYDNAEPLLAYGLLYSAYDEVSDAEYLPGELLVEPQAVVMVGESLLDVSMQPVVYMDGVGQLDVSFSTAVVMTGTGTLSATMSNDVAFLDVEFEGTGQLTGSIQIGGNGLVTLQPLEVLGGDYDFQGVGSTSLPYLTVSGTEGAYVPVQPSYGYLTLPFMSVFALGSTEHTGNSDLDLPYVAVLGGDYAYGFGDMTLNVGIYAGGWGELIGDDELYLFSGSYVKSAETAFGTDVVLILNSFGSLVDSLTLTRQDTLALISQLQQSSIFSLSQSYVLSLVSTTQGYSLQTLALQTGASVPDGSAVWVINLETSASTRYDGYGFNSFFQRDKKYYGVADDGIYLLEGETDNGAPIDALIDLGKSNQPSTKVKHVPSVYLGVASDGKMILKVDADGIMRYYEARTNSEALRQHRVDVGRGTRGVFWNFTVMNQNGDDFELANVEFQPITVQRRI